MNCLFSNNSNEVSPPSLLCRIKLHVANPQSPSDKAITEIHQLTSSYTYKKKLPLLLPQATTDESKEKMNPIPRKSKTPKFLVD